MGREQGQKKKKKLGRGQEKKNLLKFFFALKFLFSCEWEGGGGMANTSPVMGHF
jgi:hypothetical protein